MIVNGTNIAAFGAKQWEVTPGKRAISNESSMFQGSYLPIMAAPDFGLCEYTIKLNVHGDSRAGIWDNVSRILNLFTEVAEVELDGFAGRMFRLSLKDTSLTEYGPQKDRWGILTLKCEGYAHGYAMEAVIDSRMFRKDAEGALVYEADIDNLWLNPSFQQCEKTTAPVPVNILIQQKQKCERGSGWFDDFLGVTYPMDADITIEGLCKNKMGKDVGSIQVEVRPDQTQEDLPGAQYSTYPARTGYGIQMLEINGDTGKTEAVYNKSVKPDTRDWRAYAETKMPCAALWGFPGQKIKFKIKPLDRQATVINPPIYLEDILHDYQIHFVHTPVYL